jgi:pantoate--beta-alanine ligase
MLELSDIPTLRTWIHSQRSSGSRIGFVPTMGYLHEGHLVLVDEARRRSEAVIMSIFVNPLQFGPGEDLERYPRDLERDRRLASARRVDALFTPSVDAMYPSGSEVRVVPGPSADRWEGAARPGHFAGVLTVVTKLFHLVEPDVACFGRKDIQQLSLVEQLVRDLNWSIEIVGVPTVRERDGLALSSRNAYLREEDRRQAVGLSRALQVAHRSWIEGERRAGTIEQRIREELGNFPRIGVQYIAVVEPRSLTPVEQVDGNTVVALAARVGGTRLLDNITLSEGVR